MGIIVKVVNLSMQADKEELLPMSLDARAYRFFPKREEEKSLFEKKGTRFFFYGQVQHDEYELRKLREFHEYVKEKDKEYSRQDFPDDHVLLQFLSSNKYKPKDTLKAMAEHVEFKREFIPSVRLELIEPMLKSGFYYPCGLDRQFRPIFVFRIKQIDVKNIDPYVQAIVYLQEQVIRKLFLPGQVQCWSLIYDLEKIGLTDLPISSLKKILSKISLNYGGRLAKLWIINAPSGMSTTWKIVSTVLDDVTVSKVKISKTNTDPSIFEGIDPSQVEIKYGGTQANRVQYFPFALPRGVIDEKRLITNEEYEKLLQEGKLARNKIDPLFGGEKH